MAGEPGVPGLRLRAPIPVERGNMLLFRRSSCLELLLMDRIVHYARLRGLVPDVVLVWAVAPASHHRAVRAEPPAALPRGAVVAPSAGG